MPDHVSILVLMEVFRPANFRNIRSFNPCSDGSVSTGGQKAFIRDHVGFQSLF